MAKATGKFQGYKQEATATPGWLEEGVVGVQVESRTVEVDRGKAGAKATASMAERMRGGHWKQLPAGTLGTEVCGRKPTWNTVCAGKDPEVDLRPKVCAVKWWLMRGSSR